MKSYQYFKTDSKGNPVFRKNTGQTLCEVEIYLKELWYLYFFYKEKINGQNVKYSSIVAKYC